MVYTHLWSNKLNIFKGIQVEAERLLSMDTEIVNFSTGWETRLRGQPPDSPLYVCIVKCVEPFYEVKKSVGEHF